MAMSGRAIWLGMGKSRSIDNKGGRQMKDKADDDMGKARHVRARTQELADTQTASRGSGSEHTNANKHTCKGCRGPRSKLEIKVGCLSFMTYHLSIDTRETRGWGKGLGGVAECQP